MLLAASIGEIEEPLRRLLPDGTLFLEFTEGLGGAWTEPDGKSERVLFGYPAGSPHPWFRIFEPEPETHNVATLALERIAFARNVTAIAVVDREALAPVRRGVRAHRGVHVLVSSEDQTREAFLRRVAATIVETEGVRP